MVFSNNILRPHALARTYDLRRIVCVAIHFSLPLAYTDPCPIHTTCSPSCSCDRHHHPPISIHSSIYNRSGPACALAARHRLAGVVLHSPVASGLRAITLDWNSTCSPVALFACLDPLNNAALATHIHCPVLIAHGAADSEVFHASLP